MVKEREKEKNQGNSEDVTVGVRQPQFPLASQRLGCLSKYMEAKYMQRGSLCCKAAENLVN